MEKLFLFHCFILNNVYLSSFDIETPCQCELIWYWKSECKLLHGLFQFNYSILILCDGEEKIKVSFYDNENFSSSFVSLLFEGLMNDFYIFLSSHLLNGASWVVCAFGWGTIENEENSTIYLGFLKFFKNIEIFYLFTF